MDRSRTDRLLRNMRESKREYLAIALVLSGGILLSGFAFTVVGQRDHERALLARNLQVGTLVLSVQRSIDQQMQILYDLASLYEASERVNRYEFGRFTQRILDQDPSIKALEWIPRITKAERARYEQAARQEGLADFSIRERDDDGQLVAVSERDYYYPVYFLAPISGNEAALGYDLGSNPVRRQALEQARDSAMPVATGRIRLVQETGAQYGFLILYPIYQRDAPRGTAWQRQQNLLGYVLAVFRIGDMIDGFLHQADAPGGHMHSSSGYDLYFFDDSAPTEERYLYHHSQHPTVTTALPESELHASGILSRNLKLPGRDWRIYFEPTAQLQIQQWGWEKWFIALGGLLFSATLAAYIVASLRRAQAERLIAERTTALELSNKELESYSYSIAHDLRTPLRTVTSFSQILLEDADTKLGPTELDSLQRVVGAGKYMAQLIDDILELSRISRTELHPQKVDLSNIAYIVAKQIGLSDPARQVDWAITPAISTVGDPRLLQIVLDNLLGNAWKYTKQEATARIEFGTYDEQGRRVYYVRDNGVGFDMQYSDKLFGTFQRLHNDEEFEGTGIGLATVARIVHRHNGHVWAQSVAGEGATFYFTLGE